MLVLPITVMVDGAVLYTVSGDTLLIDTVPVPGEVQIAWAWAGVAGPNGKLIVAKQAAVSANRAPMVIQRVCFRIAVRFPWYRTTLCQSRLFFTAEIAEHTEIFLFLCGLCGLCGKSICHPKD